jgi:hypothetical protein
LSMIIVNRDKNEIIITPEDFKRFWQKLSEFTSSSMSGVHYGHYKAAIKDELSTEIMAQQLTVIARSGIPPESWSIGLQVILEKSRESVWLRNSKLFNHMRRILTVTTNLFLDARKCKRSQTAVIFQRNYSANKEAQQRRPNLTKLLWLTFLDRPGIQ